MNGKNRQNENRTHRRIWKSIENHIDSRATQSIGNRKIKFQFFSNEYFQCLLPYHIAIAITIKQQT